MILKNAAGTLNTKNNAVKQKVPSHISTYIRWRHNLIEPVFDQQRVPSAILLFFSSFFLSWLATYGPKNIALSATGLNAF